MSLIPGIDPKHQYTPWSNDYDKFRDQYATSSYDFEARMNPGVIVRVEFIDEIQKAIRHAESNKIAVAVRTGGHQYEGASSTTLDNIQLDLRQSFRKKEDQHFFQTPDGKAYVRTSVSWDLAEFNKFLGNNQVFVPHGQCSYVGLGGHVQTGGYGQLGRSFGLLGDHVTKLEIVDHNGDIKDDVTKDSNEELFFALLGGSPGNLGVITHFTIEVHRDRDHNFSKNPMPLGMKTFYHYSPETLKLLLDKVVQMSEDVDFPRNYDLCITVLSERGFLETAEMGEERHPDLSGDDNTVGGWFPVRWHNMIVLYAQWVPFAETDDLGKALEWFQWFEQNQALKDSHYFGDTGPVQADMSKLTSKWLFPYPREFNAPYIKRTYVTKSTTLDERGWASWISTRIDDIIKNKDVKISVQIQCFGGKNSKFVTNADNGTSYSWRDSTVVCVLDGFHGPTHAARAYVKRWHELNDEAMIGKGRIFSEDDRRVLWGSYGNFDLDAVWRCYYESQDKYYRLGRARQAADPYGVFTPNTFCVKRKV